MTARHPHPAPYADWWRLSMEAGAIATAAPVVIAHRCWRMMMAGPSPDPRDRREFARMAPEKMNAAAQAQRAAWREAYAAQAAWWSAVTSGTVAPWRWAEHTWHAWPRIAGRSLEPIRRTVHANARRLSSASGRRRSRSSGR